MFGDIMGMMGKLKETQQKVEETKKRLDFVLIDEKSNDGLLEVTLNANRTIKSITVSDDLLNDKEMLEDYLVTTLNKAIEKATNVHETELAAVAKEGMPNIPGMDMFNYNGDSKNQITSYTAFSKLLFLCASIGL
jgi:DNA-binding YbaB/EbfC family protein